MTWKEAVKDGLAEGSVQENENLLEVDKERGMTVELVVENFFGCKRATGIGATGFEAQEALVANLEQAFPDGPVVTD